MFTQKFPYLCASIIGVVIFPLLIYTCKYSVDTRKGSGSVSADMYTRGVRYTIQPQLHFKEKVLKSCLLSTFYEEIMFVIQFCSMMILLLYILYICVTFSSLSWKNIQWILHLYAITAIYFLAHVCKHMLLLLQRELSDKWSDMTWDRGCLAYWTRKTVTSQHTYIWNTHWHL